MNKVICMSSPTEIAQALTHSFKEKGWSQIEVSTRTSVHQSQVSRILSGEFKRCTKHVKTLCKYAEITLQPQLNDPRSNQKLMDVLSQVWDGTEAHAEILARILLAVNGLRR